MSDESALQFLKSVRLLAGLPEDRLRELARLLRPEARADGEVVFEEGGPGDSLYFVSSGHVRIAKKIPSEDGRSDYKELAVVGPGGCFGEMALVESVRRSADAIASGETVLLRLGRAEFESWLKGKADPLLAMQLFTGVVEVVSANLRRSSNELTLLFDLSQLLLEPFRSPRDLLDKVLRRLRRYLEGGWRAAAYVYNEFNDEMELVDVEGPFQADGLGFGMDPAGNAWSGESVYQVVFPGRRRAMGFLVFHWPEPLGPEERNEKARTLTTVGRLVAAALENLAYRTDEELRSRLKANIQSGTF